MNRTELIDAAAASANLPRAEVAAALDALVFEVTKSVRSGDAARITGFGTFKLRNRAARTARNPRTGEAIKIKASKAIGFTAGTQLKADLNAKDAPKSG